MVRPTVVSHCAETSVDEFFEKMLDCQQDDILYCDYTCSGLIYDYIIYFHRLMDNALDTTRSRQLSMLLPVIKYINENFRNDIVISDLCAIIHITPQHFCRVFKQVMNMRPNEYIAKARIDEAKRLLLVNNISISEAAAIAGFRNPGYFSTVFKKYVGVTPNEFQKSKGILESY